MEAKDFKHIKDQETRALLFYALREHKVEESDLFRNEIGSNFGELDGATIQNILQQRGLIFADPNGINQMTPRGIKVLVELNLLDPTELLFHSSIPTRNAVVDYLKGEQ